MQFQSPTIRFMSFIFLFIFSISSTAQSQKGKGFDLGNLDKSINPAVDFYEYAIGGWRKSNPIPDAYSRWGAFEQLAERTNLNLKSIVEKAAASHNWNSGSAEQKVGDFYSTGMDSAQIERLGIKPLLPELAKIERLKNSKDLIKLFGQQALYGVRVPFNFFAGTDAKKSDFMVSRIYQGGLALPDVEYYTKDDARSKEIREKYLLHVAKMFSLLGDDSELSLKNAATVLDIETRLAKASNTRLQNRDPEKTYNKMGIDQLKNITTGFDWDLYFAGLEISNPPVIVISQPGFLQEVATMVREIPLDQWKTYLRWHYINGAAYSLSSDFVNEKFNFFGTFLTGAKVIQPRWKRILQSVNGAMGELVGEIYVKDYFPPEAKERARSTVSNILASMSESIKNLEWMSSETKEKALHKLSTFGVKIGYPDKWKDYSRLEVKRDTYFKNIMRANYWASKDNLEKIGKPVDKTQWAMSPQTVNAYYNPTINEIVFPAAILQWPFFDKDTDDAINYGAMGAVIGHEITHGFDDQGRKYDADGNLKDWWTKEDNDRFIARANFLVEQFNGFTAIDTFRVDGKLTLGENIGDLGGLTIAYNAFKKTSQFKSGEKIDGFTPQQRFFLGWAQVWAENSRDQYLKLQLKTDVHSPGRFRVNGPLKNLPEFFEAFDIKPGDPMRLPEGKIVKIW